MFGWNVSCFLPSIVFVDVSSVNSRSPCAIPFIPNSGKYSSATFNFSTRPGESP